jgi:steroid delta-isomerase-like uncharacterized protein
VSDENKQAVRRIYEEVLGGGDLDAADELIAEDVAEPNRPPGLPPGREGFKQWASMMREIFPDLSIGVDVILAEDDLVAARATWRGTNTGSVMGRDPTGKSITVTSTDIFRFDGGKLVEHLGDYDQLGMFRQLGMLQL